MLKRSRRDFLKQATLLTAAPGILLRSGWGADTKYVVAETAFGKVRGIDDQGIKVFKGVPYGANTAGKNRFMPPLDPAKWTGVRDALQYGHSAPQTEPGARRGGKCDAAGEVAGCPGGGEPGRGHRRPRRRRLAPAALSQAESRSGDGVGAG